jgi:Zn-dependent peptidase ImmA (M78 family)/transcriptional regulator with XRE-family HTH domain
MTLILASKVTHRALACRPASDAILLALMPNVNPQILSWARSSAGLTIEDAARCLGISSPQKLERIESGEDEPSRPQLLNMAKQYRRPLLTFYLASPPKIGSRGEDFRSVSRDELTSDDAHLDALLRDIQTRQSMVRSTLKDEDDPAPLKFIGSASMALGVVAVSRLIQDSLTFDLIKYRRCKSSEDAFAYVRRLAEGIGVFVILAGNLGTHHTAIPVSTFRGFAISDAIAPFVVINDQDAKTAWSFTLLHELAHLWLGATGVSASNSEQAIEQFCNDVAGETLLPLREIRALQHMASLEGREIIGAVSNFAHDSNLSRQMVIYRLFKAGYLDWTKWRSLNDKILELRALEKVRQRLIRGKEGGNPSYYVVRRHRLGNALIDFAARNVSAGTLTPVKAAKVLGVKPRSVYNLLQRQPLGEFQ